MKNGLHAMRERRREGEKMAALDDVETAIDFFLSRSIRPLVTGGGVDAICIRFSKRETFKCVVHCIHSIFHCIHLYTLHTIPNGSGKDMQGAKRMWMQHTPKYAYFYCDSVNLNRCVQISLSLSRCTD